MCNNVQEPHAHCVDKSSQTQRTHAVWIHFYTLKDFDTKTQTILSMDVYLYSQILKENKDVTDHKSWDSNDL